jgi:nucleoside-diphosphate-sugar epimerase
VSSSEVYGSAQTVPISEDHPLNPQSPYAASKVAADKLMDSFHRSYELPVAVVRPFNTYGPHQSARAVIPTIITQALSGTVLHLGSLDTRRDLTFVADTCAGILAAAAAPAVVGRTVQLGTGNDVSVREIVAQVAVLLDKDLSVEVDAARIRPERSEVLRLVSSPALARELMDWEPRIELRDGLAQTVDWIDRNKARYRAEQYVI